MSDERDWTLLWRLMVLGVLAVLLVSHTDWAETPAISKVDTVALDISIVRNAATRSQADADQAMALCGYARSEAALADAKADWLRAHLLTFYQRYGQGKMAARLTPWPGGDTSPMESIR